MVGICSVCVSSLDFSVDLLLESSKNSLFPIVKLFDGFLRFVKRRTAYSISSAITNVGKLLSV